MRRYRVETLSFGHYEARFTCQITHCVLIWVAKSTPFEPNRIEWCHDLHIAARERARCIAQGIPAMVFEVREITDDPI